MVDGIGEYLVLEAKSGKWTIVLGTEPDGPLLDFPAIVYLQSGLVGGEEKVICR